MDRTILLNSRHLLLTLLPDERILLTVPSRTNGYGHECVLKMEAETINLVTLTQNIQGSTRHDIDY